MSRIDITTPAKWHRSFAWRFGKTPWIVAAAFSPTAFFVGAEIINGYAKGFAVGLGPLWLGIALVLEPRP